MKFLTILLLVYPSYTLATSDEEVMLNVAVATNFRAPMLILREHFETRSHIGIAPTFGASGLLTAQIRQGAPFDVFLSADAARPRALVDDGFAEAPSITYAEGRVALWTPGRAATPSQIAGKRLAIANPPVAPYGHAAAQCLRQLGLWETVEAHLVFGNNVSQVNHFVTTTAVPAGFVALSQLLAARTPEVNYWVCPPSYHDPIDQQGVVLAASTKPGAARAFLQFLTDSDTQALLATLGYPRR